MGIQEKLKILKSLDTKNLIEKLHEYEGELLQALTQQADFTAQNAEYLSSRGSDCSKVKELIAELAVQAPDINGKKMTIAERDAWLTRQRTENNELSEAIQKQRQISFLQDDYEIKLEMTKRRLENTKAVLNLKRAQIDFLGGD